MFLLMMDVDPASIHARANVDICVLFGVAVIC